MALEDLRAHLANLRAPDSSTGAAALVVISDLVKAPTGPERGCRRACWLVVGMRQVLALQPYGADRPSSAVTLDAAGSVPGLQCTSQGGACPAGRTAHQLRAQELRMLELLGNADMVTGSTVFYAHIGIAC